MKHGGINEEDQKDFEQEQLIKQWLEHQSSNQQFEFKHITCNGTARNTLIKASLSLDQKVQDDSTGTFADLIAGSDGRELDSGTIDYDPQNEAREQIQNYLVKLGFTQEEIPCLEKILKLSILLEEMPSEKSQTDSEW